LGSRKKVFGRWVWGPAEEGRKLGRERKDEKKVRG